MSLFFIVLARTIAPFCKTHVLIANYKNLFIRSIQEVHMFIPIKKRLLILLVLLLSLVGLLLSQEAPLLLVKDYILFSVVGVVGAIFANATGAGGGVVFVPLFNQFSFSPMNIVATSFAIQCFGMTAGAISWRDQYLQNKRDPVLSPIWHTLPKLLILTVPFSILGVWLNQFSGWINIVMHVDHLLHWIFGSFSILLAIALFVTLPKLQREEQPFLLTRFDCIALPLIAMCGGVITAWLSIGVGEMVAVYLILRSASVTMAIAVAVILTACSVWGGIGYFILLNEIALDKGVHGFSTIIYPVAFFAGLGAIVGGTIAKRIVLFFPPIQVKVFFGFWVLFMGVASLPLW